MPLATFHSYNPTVICPNEKTEMRQVKTESHYGQTIMLEQCTTCGGLWFDKSELYRTRQGEAEKVELLESEILRVSSRIESTVLLCPRDGERLVRFSDRFFPKGVILERCPACEGFWLNRGEFTNYQRVRQERQRPKEAGAADRKLEERIEHILAAHRSGRESDGLTRIANFLSTPIDRQTLRPLESGPGTVRAEGAAGLVMNVLMTLLNAFLLRR